jgi:hypothetical protein
MYITGVQLEKGSVATPFEVRPYATELALCQRYYEQSYSIGTVAGTNTNLGQATFHGASDDNSNMGGMVRYSVPKRITVTPVIYAPGGTINSLAYTKSGVVGSVVAASTTYRNEFSFLTFTGVGGAFVISMINFHWTASAEL